jgi:hypothetical protein
MNLWTVNDEGKIELSLHRGQARAWRSDRRFVFVIAGTQGGKTSFGPWWLWREIQRCGEGDYIAATATYKLFTRKMLPELTNVFCHTLNIARYWAGDALFELKDPETGKFRAEHSYDPMWGRVMLGAGSSPGGLEAATAKAAWLDECGQDEFALEAWEAVQRRLSLAQGRVLGTTTPYNLGWLKSEVYDPWAEGDPDIDVISFPSIWNPAFPMAEFERVEKRMQEWRFGMFYRGQFTRPAGLIYNCWDDAMLIDPFPIPDEWERAVGVDFGGANNAILWAANDPQTDRWIVYDEWLGGGLTSEEYGEKARSKLPDGAEYYSWGGAKSEDQARRDWALGEFVISEPPISDIEQGIDRGIQLIKDNRLRVFRSCRGLRDEFGSYRRKMDDSGTALEDIENKRRFHRLDAYRYMACGIVEQTGPWIILLD